LKGAPSEHSRNALERLTPVQFRGAIAASCLAILAGDLASEWPVSLLYVAVIGLTFWSRDRWMPMATALAAASGVVLGTWAPFGPVPGPWSLVLRAGGALIFLGVGWLLTRHRALLAAAEERETVLRAIFDAEPACVKLMGRGGVLIDMNRAGLEFMGAATIESVKGQTLLPLIVEEFREAFRGMTDRVFKGESVGIQFECYGSRGRRRWVDSRNAPLRNAAGEVTAILSVSSDITHQKRAEALLRDSESRLAQAAEIAGLGFFEHDHRTDRTYWSDGARAILGMTPAEERSIDGVFASIHPEERQTAAAIAARAHDPAGDGVMATSHRLVRSVGDVRYLSMRSQTFFEETGDGPTPRRTVGTLLDVTEPRRAEAQLRLSEERLALATEIAGLGFFEKDYRTGVVYWSEGARLIFGMPDGETWPPDALIRFAHPADRADLIAARTRLVDPSSGVLDLGHRIVRPSGEIRHVQVRALMYFEDRGDGPEPKRAVATLWDVTETKRAEAQRDALARRVIEVQEDQRRAVARDLHDEIGQALSALKLNLSRLRRDGGGSEPFVTDSLRIADEVLQHVRDLALSLRPSVLDDLGLGAAVQWLSEQSGTRANLNVTCEVDANVTGLPPATEIACFRVLQEALTNVIRHAHASTVLVRLRGDDAHLELLVQDDGRGFDVARVTAEAGRGASMGLLGIRERAALLGGRTTIASAPGAGCQIRVFLPLEASGASRVEVHASGDAAAAS
jgi:two-component system sensor histidine kinase UhpB